MPQVPSTRWCPTPEQLMKLEDMYRAGLRTPNASQIQSITSHLSYYGKIEGKNVFYWFQNHKARDRQKLRKRLFRQPHHQLAHHASLIPLRVEAPFSLPSQPSSQGVREEIAQAMSLMGRHDKSEREEEQQRSAEMSAMASKYEWKMPTAGSSGAPSWCRPLRTLDLFPTRITGIRTDDVASNSSSLFPSTN